MIAFTVALGISLATAMLNVMFDVGDKVNQELKAYGANMNIVPRGSSLLSDLYEVDENYDIQAGAEKFLKEEDLPKIKMIFWANNIVDFTPYLQIQVKIGQEKADLVGTWFEKNFKLPTGDEFSTGILPLKPWWDIDGQPGDDEILNKVMVGKELAEHFNLKPGDSFTVVTDRGERSLTVGSVFQSGGREDEQIYAPLQLVQNISGKEGLVQRVEVSALTTPENELARRAAQDPNSLSSLERDAWYCTAYISAIAYQIEEVIPEARVKAVWQVADSEGSILQKTQLLMLLLTFLILLCSALAISNLITASVMERSAEIGLMKAMGAGNISITLLILYEILIIAFSGGAIGYCAGIGFAQLIGHTVFASAVAVKGIVIPLIIILIMIITFLGSLPAIRILLSLRPSEVLHG
ncbi:MAG: ABC transporter permease [Desulfarculales bacterium]|nr:ABC transporter permease [Desulfarculales bacterium]